MGHSRTLDVVVEDFQNFVRGHKATNESLGEYIRDWLTYGRGASDCLNNYQFFLSVTILIINEWLRNPELLNYDGGPDGGEDEPVIKRRVSKLFRDDGRDSETILDPYSFMLDCL